MRGRLLNSVGEIYDLFGGNVYLVSWRYLEKPRKHLRLVDLSSGWLRTRNHRLRIKSGERSNLYRDICNMQLWVSTVVVISSE
jgi:hypothetical protein